MRKINVKEIALFAVLGVILFVADIAFEALPNIHLVGVLIVVITAVYKYKALFPIDVLVDTVHLRLGCSLGIYDVNTEEFAQSRKTRDLLYCVRASRNFVWHTLCPLSSAFFWS